MRANSTEKSFFPRILAILCLVLSASCSSGDRVEGYLYYRVNHNPTTLDPSLIIDVSGGSIAAKIFNGLVRLDEQFNVLPDISDRWEVTGDGKVYTFHLKKGVCFTNAREVMADDFKYSFQRVLDPKGRSPNSWVFEKIEGARAYRHGSADDVRGISVTGPYTLRISLEQPFSPFLYLLAMTAAYVVPREEVERAGGDFGHHPTGTGPYRLREWRHNERILLERNEGYFDGRAALAGIAYRVIPEDLTAVTEFELGNLDVIAIPASEYRRFSTSAEWRHLVASRPGINTYYLGFNCSRPPFDDPVLRRAVARAINRKKILDTYYEQRGILALGPVPEALRSWDAPQPPAYDPNEARKAFQKSYVKERTIRFYITADQEVADIAEIIQSYLKAAGLRVDIRRLEWSSYKVALNNGEADMFWISWWADYPDPENFLFPLFHSSNHGPGGNRTWYTNLRVDALIEEGQRSSDSSARTCAYAEAERLIVEDAAWVPFWHRTDITVRRPSVMHYRVYPIYSMDKGMEVSF